MNPYNNKKEYKQSIQNLLCDINNNKINLNPLYQRDTVWLKDNKSVLIDSIMLNILPSPIVFNNDNKNQKYNCIDGKQRITTIISFAQNEFSIKINKKKSVL